MMTVRGLPGTAGGGGDGATMQIATSVLIGLDQSSKAAATSSGRSRGARRASIVDAAER